MGLDIWKKGIWSDGFRSILFFYLYQREAKLRRGPQTGWKFPLGLALWLSEHRDFFHGPPPAYKVSLHVSVKADFSKALKIEET